MTKALLFDDNSDFRNIIIAVLRDYDIEIEDYHDPSCYLKNSDKCPVNKPCVDFILTDNQMPHVTGVEFLQKLQEMECKVPIQNMALMSGDLPIEEVERIISLGVKFFRKPFSLTDVENWLEDIGLLSR